MKNLLKFIMIPALIYGGYIVPAQAQATSKAGTTYSTNAREDIKKAVAEARVSHKHIIVQAGSGGCMYCARLNKFIAADPEIRRAAAAFIIVYADFQANAALLNSYGRVSGTPHFFVFDERGRLLRSQETDSMEQGNSYDRDIVLDFFITWAVKRPVKRVPKKSRTEIFS